MTEAEAPEFNDNERAKELLKYRHGKLKSKSGGDESGAIAGDDISWPSGPPIGVGELVVWLGIFVWFCVTATVDNCGCESFMLLIAIITFVTDPLFVVGIDIVL